MPPKTSAQYAADIKVRYQESQAAPSNPDKLKKLNYSVSAWEKSLKKTIIRANNEGNPWEESELKMPIRHMPTKAKSGFDQTADYICYYEGSGVAGYCGVLVERKGGDKKKGGPQDLYSTLMIKENCERFYREIDRFQNDPRFSQMVVIAECSFEQFLLYCPPFIGKERNIDHIGASVEARRGKIASLYMRGIPVIFCGTRFNAVECYKALTRQWIIKNYVTILKLDEQPYDDYEELLKKKAAIEEKRALIDAEYQAVCGALGVHA